MGNITVARAYTQGIPGSTQPAGLYSSFSIASGLTIPASGGVTVVMSDTGYLSDGRSLPVIIQGIQGTLARAGSTYTFTRFSSGSSSSVASGVVGHALGVASFDAFSSRPTGLGVNDAGKTFLYTRTGNWHQWTGTTWTILDQTRINVLDYGLTGLGIADESAAFTALLALNLGTKYYFPKGQYKFNSTQYLNVYTANVHRDAPQIIGDGIDSTVFINNVANGALFEYKQSAAQIAGFTFGYGLGFQDFTIQGTGVANSDGISVAGAANPFFHRLKVISVSGHGYVFPFDTRAVIEGTSPNQYHNADAFSNGFSDFLACTAQICGKWGWYIDTGNSAVSMNNCFASLCVGGGLYLQSGTSILNNCSFSYCGSFYDLKSAGIWLGDDYNSAKTGLLTRSYPTIFNCTFVNIELDSNYNRQMFVSGYSHYFRNIRLILGSLPAISGSVHNTPIEVQFGAGDYALTNSRFEGVTQRTPQGNTLSCTVFSDNLGYANNSSVGGSYARNVTIDNFFDFIPNGAVTKYQISNSFSRGILATEDGQLVFAAPSAVPTTGTWPTNYVINILNPPAGTYERYRCTAGGTPGTWKGVGLIQS
jgi:hypothetical protein